MNVLDAPQVIDAPNGDFRTLLLDWLPANLDTLGQEPLLLLNHPATSNSPSSREYGIDDFDGDADRWRAALDPRAHLINLMNGPSHTAGTGLRPGRPSESEFRRYLDLGLHVAPTADQDNHKKNWGTATEARTGVVADQLTKVSAAHRDAPATGVCDARPEPAAGVSGQRSAARVTHHRQCGAGGGRGLRHHARDCG